MKSGKCPDCHFEGCEMRTAPSHVPQRCCACDYEWGLKHKRVFQAFEPCGECFNELDGEDKIELMKFNSDYCGGI